MARLSKKQQEETEVRRELRQTSSLVTSSTRTVTVRSERRKVEHSSGQVGVGSGKKMGGWPMEEQQLALVRDEAPDAGHHYSENILLRFATEHSGGDGPGVSQSYQRSTLLAGGRAAKESNNNNNYYARSSTLPGRPQTSVEPSLQQQQQQQVRLLRPGNQQAHHQQQQPSHYQPQMAVGKFVNYYPAERQPSSQLTSSQRNYSFHVPLSGPGSNGGQLCQSRYASGAPPKPSSVGWSGAFKSRTISHLPEAAANQYESGSNYEHLYERARLSETDLYKAHRVSLVGLEPGSDNPFRPGTELSWEADLMVRLMKRGYPLAELPALIRSAKQIRPDGGQLSVAELGSRQARSATLGRARSMPRALAKGAPQRERADSLDRLIANMEDERQARTLEGALERPASKQELAGSSPLMRVQPVKQERSRSRAPRRASQQAESDANLENRKLVRQNKCCKIH